jgi:hypothetical protein
MKTRSCTVQISKYDRAEDKWVSIQMPCAFHRWDASGTKALIEREDGTMSMESFERLTFTDKKSPPEAATSGEHKTTTK